MQQKILRFLRWSQKYAQTDMVYAAQGGFWLSATKIVGFFIALAVTAAFARWLPKETYGAYNYILSITAITGIFTLSGLNSTFIRSIVRKKEGMLAQTAKIRIKWSSIGSALSLAIAFWYFFRQNKEMAACFIIAAAFLPFFETLHQLTIRFWQAKKRFFTYSVYKTLFQFLGALVLIPVIFFTNNLIIIILAFFISQSVWSALLFFTTFRSRENNDTENETLRFGQHLTVMQGIEILGKNIDKIIIWHFLGPVAVAMYSFAQLPIMKLQEINPIQSLAIIKLSEKQDLRTIKAGMMKKFWRLFILTIPFIAFLIILAPWVYKIMFPAYIDSVPYFQILSLMLLSFPFLLFNSAFIAQLYKKELYITVISNLAVRVVLFLLLAPFYGVWGIIISVLITQAINNLLLLYFFKKV